MIVALKDPNGQTWAPTRLQTVGHPVFVTYNEFRCEISFYLICLCISARVLFILLAILYARLILSPRSLVCNAETILSLANATTCVMLPI